MVTGCLAKAGYFVGDDLWAANEFNPKGFFEGPEINDINEQLLSGVTPHRPRLLGRWFFRDRPVHGQRWLARLPVGVSFSASRPIENRIQNLTRRTPYAFKDPRFSYTLPVWRPFVKDAVFICVFRHPSITCRSIQKMMVESPYLRPLSLTEDQIFETWYYVHRHILETHRHEGSWLFLHYNEMLRPKGVEKLQQFVGVPVDGSFPDYRLNHSSPKVEAPKNCLDLYDELCQLAGYEE
jgi:hypothetical protein